VDIPRARDNFAFFSGAIRHDFTECHMMGGNMSASSVDENGKPNTAAVNYTQRAPVGVAGLITPWNLPLYLLSWKVAPALACGNTIVAKPSELSPHTATALAEICHKVGLPAGVFNIVHGTGAVAGQALVAHKDVPLISFTGGTATGAIVASVAAPLFKKVSLELGGKNASVVFADADLKEAVAIAARSAFTNQGQVCLSGSRVFVQAAVYDAFVEQFVAAAKQLIPGDPESANFGAVISHGHWSKVTSYIELAKQEGGTVLCGGGKPADLPAGFEDGYFVAPTIIAGLSPTSRCSSEEIFGPVIVVHKFESEEEVLAEVNRSSYGLAGSLFTTDLKRAHRFSQRWETGMVWVNCWLQRDLRVPFGGVKQSGVGSEGGRLSLEFFSQLKNICIKL
jgi:aminomuconate-semialdehyde/2-hydroxymuconate-6-semialdehyde dehydrogenase